MISCRFLHVFSLTAIMVLFLPSVFKGIHDFAHKNDSRCNEQSEQHFHTDDHHCTICSFVAFTSLTKLVNIFSKILPSFHNIDLLPAPTFLTSGFELFLTGRAPPFLLVLQPE